MVFCFLHSQQRRVQFLHRFERGETLAILFMLFRLPHSQKRRVQLLFRFEKGKTLAICFFHGFPFPFNPFNSIKHVNGINGLNGPFHLTRLSNLNTY